MPVVLSPKDMVEVMGFMDMLLLVTCYCFIHTEYMHGYKF